MKYKKIKKSFFALSLETRNEVKSFYNSMHEFEIGYLYTFFHEYENKILVAFIKSVDIACELYKNNGYQVIDKKSGFKKESDLLKKTLFELGHKDLNSNGIYNYSNELLNHLNILGWPIGQFKKYHKRYK